MAHMRVHNSQVPNCCSSISIILTTLPNNDRPAVRLLRYAFDRSCPKKSCLLSTIERYPCIHVPLHIWANRVELKGPTYKPEGLDAIRLSPLHPLNGVGFSASMKSCTAHIPGAQLFKHGKHIDSRVKHGHDTSLQTQYSTCSLPSLMHRCPWKKLSICFCGPCGTLYQTQSLAVPIRADLPRKAKLWRSAWKSAWVHKGHLLRLARMCTSLQG